MFGPSSVTCERPSEGSQGAHLWETDRTTKRAWFLTWCQGAHLREPLFTLRTLMFSSHDAHCNIKSEYIQYSLLSEVLLSLCYCTLIQLWSPVALKEKYTYSSHIWFRPQTQTRWVPVHIAAGQGGSSGRQWQEGRPGRGPTSCCTNEEWQVRSPV